MAEPASPVANVHLWLVDSTGARIELGQFDAHGELGTITQSVHLPTATKPGKATLRLGDAPAVHITVGPAE